MCPCEVVMGGDEVRRQIDDAEGRSVVKKCKLLKQSVEL